MLICHELNAKMNRERVFAFKGPVCRTQWYPLSRQQLFFNIKILIYSITYVNNSLPLSIQTETNVVKFKKKVKNAPI